MLLIYYVLKDGRREWIMSTDKQGVDDYISEHDDIEEYYVTVIESECNRLKGTIEYYERKAQEVKAFINKTL